MSGDSRTELKKRKRRKEMTRAVTESIKDIKKKLTPSISEDTEIFDERPTHRGDCEDSKRPCPWVGCKYHLYLDVNPDTGAIKINFPSLEVWELPETCCLDVADRNGMTLDSVGNLMNLSRERVRQIEVLISKRLTPYMTREGFVYP